MILEKALNLDKFRAFFLSQKCLMVLTQLGKVSVLIINNLAFRMNHSSMHNKGFFLFGFVAISLKKGIDNYRELVRVMSKEFF
jgi:hypothetical protein